MQWALMGRRVLRRVLRRVSKKGLSRRHLEGRSTPFREYDPVGVCPIFPATQICTEQMDTEGLGRKLLLMPSGDPPQNP